MQQAIEQRLSVRGDITVHVIEVATGEVVRRMEIRNLIMTNGLAVIGQLLAGYTTLADTRHLGEIHVGTGSTPPVVGNTDVETNPGGTPVTVPVVTTVSTGSGQIEIKCIGQLTTSQANGYAISEAGLYTVDTLNATPQLFARQVFPGVPKSAALAISFDWRITLTA